MNFTDFKPATILLFLIVVGFYMIYLIISYLAKKEERERLTRLKLEQERIDKERMEKLKLEQEKIEKFNLEQERLERLKRQEEEMKERERLTSLKLEQERMGKERMERLKLEWEKAERLKLEQEMVKQQKIEQERINKEVEEREGREREEKLNLVVERAKQQERERQERIDREREESVKNSKNEVRQNVLLDDEENKISTKDVKKVNAITNKKISLLKKRCYDYFWKRVNYQKLGKMYERYVGYYFENQGYDIEYFGIRKKFSDEGVDLIATKKNEIFIIQCKHWGEEYVRMQGENAIHTFYGKASMFLKKNFFDKKFDTTNIKILFVCHKNFTKEAMKAGKSHDVDLLQLEMPRTREYPYIKCFQKGDKWFFSVPFDKNYDRIKKPKYITFEELENLDYEHYEN